MSHSPTNGSCPVMMTSSIGLSGFGSKLPDGLGFEDVDAPPLINPFAVEPQGPPPEIASADQPLIPLPPTAPSAEPGQVAPAEGGVQMGSTNEHATANAGLAIDERAAAHVRGSRTIDELIYGWVGEQRATRICQGTNDEDGRPGYFAVLEDARQELASVWLEPSVLRDRYSTLIPYPSPEVQDEMPTPAGMVFDTILWTPVISTRMGGLMAVSLLLSNSAEARFSEVSPEDIEQWDMTDEERESLRPFRIISCECQYHQKRGENGKVAGWWSWNYSIKVPKN